MDISKDQAQKINDMLEKIQNGFCEARKALEEVESLAKAIVQVRQRNYDLQQKEIKEGTAWIRTVNDRNSLPLDVSENIIKSLQSPKTGYSIHLA